MKRSTTIAFSLAATAALSTSVAEAATIAAISSEAVAVNECYVEVTAHSGPGNNDNYFTITLMNGPTDPVPSQSFYFGGELRQSCSDLYNYVYNTSAYNMLLDYQCSINPPASGYIDVTFDPPSFCNQAKTTSSVPTTSAKPSL